MSDDGDLFALFGAIATGDRPQIARRLASVPELGRRPLGVGASRADAATFYLGAISHYAYAGDTALHIAGASYARDVAETLVAGGADVHAGNRRGARPLHYAVDGGPGTEHWDPAAQRDVVGYLIAAGADPDALDKSGVAALHRAVRNRCSAAVRALVDLGADPRLRTKRGSTPMMLAVRNTGKSNSGSVAAKDEQRQIIAALRAATET